MVKMFLSNTFPLGILLAGIIPLLLQKALAADTDVSEIFQHMTKKKWVTAGSTFSQSEGSYIGVIVGGKKRIIYRGDPRYPIPSRVAVSPSGEKLAFVQFVESAGSKQGLRKVCTIKIDGSEYTEVFEIKNIFFDIAWSHDHKKLAFLGELKDGFYGLVVVDISTAPGVIVAQRPLPTGMSMMGITSQAWAPTNEQLVYVNAQGRMTIFDVKANTEDDLGAGTDPTWSRNGSYIAYYQPSATDYFLISLVPPRRSERLLPNSQSAVTTKGPSGLYLGPAIWSPDDLFLMIVRALPRGTAEIYQPYVLDISKGKIEPMPLASMGDMNSWGGKL